MHERWQQCIDQLASELSEQAFRTWIRPLVFVGHDLDRHRIRLGAPSAVKADVVRRQYGQLIRQVVRDRFGDDDLGVHIEVVGGAQAVADGADEARGGAALPASGAVLPAAAGAALPASGATLRPGAAHDGMTMPGASAGHGIAAGQPVAGGHGIEAGSSTAPAHGIAATQAGVAHPDDGGALVQADDDDADGWGSGADPGLAFVEADIEPVPSPEAAERAVSRSTTPAGAAAVGAAPAPARPGPRLPPGAFPATQGGRSTDDRSKLNFGLTFGNFVTGKANDLARAAALQVAERPGGAYNPLFIHGGVGLGKTHLMQAVGNAVRLTNPEAGLRYVTANQFFQDMVSAVRRESVDQFKRYYQTLDLLLIDDIQFLSEKKRSQEEFFYVFEALVQRQRQILITCDTYPKELSQMDDRLVSRFNSGLIVAIEPPELEMRVAILQRKAEAARVRVPDEVCYFVAKHIRQNVRELEGALQRIIHYAAFRNAPIDLNQVKDALKDILSFNRGQISIEMIQRTVAEYYKIKLADMYSKRRPAKIALPRQIAMYLAKELTQKSLPEIGEAFGGRDHTTVLHAVRKIAEVRAHKTDINHEIHVLEQTLREYL